MKRRLASFNFNLLLAMALLCAGCRSQDSAAGKPKPERRDKKEVSTLFFYLEERGSRQGNTAPVFRANPVYVPIAAEPFLDMANVTDASVVDSFGGHAIQIRFDPHGAFVLDTITTANKGKRIAIFAKFPEPRWLAAPVIQGRNATGAFVFTPDATREESERFVRGLKNAVARMKR